MLPHKDENLVAFKSFLDETYQHDLLRCEVIPTLDLSSIGVGVVYGIAVTLIVILGFVSIVGD